MKKFISLFKLKFISSLQYRTAALAGVSTQFFFGMIYVMVYVTFYDSNNTADAPMQLQNLINYLWLNQSLFALVYTWTKDVEFIDLIKKGALAYELCRPINFYLKSFFTFYAKRLGSVILRFFPIIVIAMLLPSPYGMTLPANIFSLITFIIFIFLSSVLVTAFSLIYHISVFYTMDEKGITTLFMVVAEILAGGTVPLAFFPGFLQKIAYVLPFRYIADYPFNIYSTPPVFSDVLLNLISVLCWIGLFIIIGYSMSKNALKNAVVQGG